MGDISKGGYPNLSSKITNYCISIGFHGLVNCYNKNIEEKSELVLKNIIAFINEDDLFKPTLSQFDICIDVTSHIDYIVVVCSDRKNKKYNPLGDLDKGKNKIQLYDGTYELESFIKDNDKENFPSEGKLKIEIAKRRDNVKKRTLFYNKRKKILNKSQHDIGYDLTRIEMKLQRRHFINNEVSVNVFSKELKEYKILYFENLKQKEKFIRQYNKANNNKHRSEIITQAFKVATTIKPNMHNIGEFIRKIDTIKFAGKNEFSVTKKEDYLYGRSKFNRKK